MKPFVLCLVMLFSTATPASLGSIPHAEIPWSEVSHGRGIMTFRKDIPSSPIVAFKGEGTIDAPVAKVVGLMSDLDRRKDWVANLAEARLVRSKSKIDRVEYMRTSAPLVKDRDFVIHTTLSSEPTTKTLIIAMESIEDAEAPITSRSVRGTMVTSRYALRSTENGTKTHLTVEIMADPNGSIPKFVVNLFQKGWPRQTIESIRELVASRDVTEQPDVKAYFDALWSGKNPRFEDYAK